MYVFCVDPEIMEKVLVETPEQMIKFKAYKRGHKQLTRTNLTGHKLTRVSNQKKLPYGIWAHLIVESILIPLFEFYVCMHEKNIMMSYCLFFSISISASILSPLLAPEEFFVCCP